MTAPAAACLPFVLPLRARLLPPGDELAAMALRRRGRQALPLRRRGSDHGFVVPLDRAQPSARQARDCWNEAEAVFLPGLLTPGLPRQQAAIAASLAMFARLRRGGRLLDELVRRLRRCDDFAYAGSAVDRDDARQIERVFVDTTDRQPAGADLWALLAWLARDRADTSLRIRFSFGRDRVEDWLQAGDDAPERSSAFAAAVFPESAAILGSGPLHRWLATLLDRPYRLSERIVYNNAPDGGAVFHHDAETSQLGVVYSQLDGQTGWLAIGKRRLARLLVRQGAARSEAAAMARLDCGDDQALGRRLNRDAAFTAQLAARGALFVLQAGDCILLPSHGIDDATWHSVFALGKQPSLAHSYGIFARQVAGTAASK